MENWFALSKCLNLCVEGILICEGEISFPFITDISLAEHIRQRRFTGAFKTLHGLTPAQARMDGAKLRAHPRIFFQISIKREEAMDYRIEKKEAFDVFGIEAICSFIDEEAMKPYRRHFAKRLFVLA